MAMGIRNPYFPAIANTWQAGQVFNQPIAANNPNEFMSNVNGYWQNYYIGVAFVFTGNYVPTSSIFNMRDSNGEYGFNIYANGVYQNRGNSIEVANTPASISPTIDSGTIYQNTTNSYQTLTLPFYASTAGTAGTVTINMGTSSTPGTWTTVYVSGGTSSTATTNYTLRVPPQWYYEVVVSGATIGTVNGVQE